MLTESENEEVSQSNSEAAKCELEMKKSCLKDEASELRQGHMWDMWSWNEFDKIIIVISFPLSIINIPVLLVQMAAVDQLRTLAAG